VEDTPEPTHVPPSEDVRRTELLANHRARIRRARWKHYATWYFAAISGCALFSTAYVLDLIWVLPWLAGMYLGLVIRAYTSHADKVYQSAYSTGLAMGIAAATEAQQHAVYHAARGEDPCDVMKLEARVPHLWEHPFVREELEATFPNVFEFAQADDDDDDGDSEDTGYNHRPRS
jgi:hypothetical protein